jgi:hypothetical protein
MVSGIIEARRDYVITDTTYTKCDLCKRLFAKAFDFTPVKKTHSFDNVVLCIHCLDKCQMLYNVNVQDIITAGSVEEWQKKQKN